MAESIVVCRALISVEVEIPPGMGEDEFYIKMEEKYQNILEIVTSFDRNIRMVLTGFNMPLADHKVKVTVV